jgi:hypothetical protein
MFSTSKTINVASVVYNMAGDIDSSDMYMKSTVLSAVLNGSSISDAIVNTSLNGLYSKKSKFLNKCKNINFGGNITTSLNKNKQINLNELYSYITVDSDEFITIEKAYIEITDIAVYADKYLLENDPSKRFTDWVSEFLPLPNRVKITFEDTTTVTFNLPSDFEFKKEYLIVYYSVYKEDCTGSLIVGTLINSNTLPDTSEYILISDTITSTASVTLTTDINIVREFSNSDPTIETDSSSSTTESFDRHTVIKENRVYLGSTSDENVQYNLYTYTEYLDYEVKTNTVITVDTIDHGTYTETVTTTTVSEYIDNDYSYRIDTQLTTSNELVANKMLIYKIGSGDTVLDNLVEEEQILKNEFYAIVPLRIDNTSVKELSSFSDISKIYKLLTEENINKVLDKINDNPNVNDIDYVYTYMGVSLNSDNHIEQEYIYKFFKTLIQYQGTTYVDYLSWINKLAKSDEYEKVYDRWLLEQKTLTIFTSSIESNSFYILLDKYYDSDIPIDIIPKNLGGGNYTWYGTPLPPNLDYSNSAIGAITPTKPTLKIRTNNSLGEKFYMQYSWFNIDEEIHSGLGKVGAKKGDYWWAVPNNVTQPYLYWYKIYITGVVKAIQENDTDGNGSINQARISLYHQIDENTYTVLHIDGLEQRNYVYEDKHVLTLGKGVIKDKTNKEFIVPLHIPTLKKLSILKKNELILRSHNIIFNSYQIVKKKWYQSGLFTAILIIAIVIITVYTAGTDSITSSWLALEIGAATGVGSATAKLIAFLIIAGVDMLAAIVLTYTFQKGFEQFVDKDIAKILSTISTIITLAYTGDVSSFSNLSNFASIDNLLMITNAVLDSNMLLKNNLELQNEVSTLSTEYNKLVKIIDSKNKEIGLVNDPVNMLQETVLSSSTFINESPRDFFTRTSLTGSDIINISKSSVYDFVNLSLNSYKVI